MAEYNILKRIKTVINSRLFPLVKKPEYLGSPYSDLFVWRNNQEWKTYFRVLDIIELFGLDPSNANSCTLIIYSNEGKEINRIDINPKDHNFQLLDLSPYLSADCGEIGTFCCIQADTPMPLLQMGCSISDRGYVAYQNKKSNILSFVHGNFDAVSVTKDREIKYQMSSMIFNREFLIQFNFDKAKENQFVLTNPTSTHQHVQILGLNISGNKDIIGHINIKRGGCAVYSI